MTNAVPDVDARIRGVFANIFKIAPDAVQDTTRRGEFERWDSLGHLELLESLRTQFQIDFSPDQALEMETVADVKRVVHAALSEAGKR